MQPFRRGEAVVDPAERNFDCTQAGIEAADVRRDPFEEAVHACDQRDHEGGKRHAGRDDRHDDPEPGPDHPLRVFVSAFMDPAYHGGPRARMVGGSRPPGPLRVRRWYVEDVAAATDALLRAAPAHGLLYHCVGSSHATWFEVTRELAARPGAARHPRHHPGRAEPARSAPPVLRAVQPQACCGGHRDAALAGRGRTVRANSNVGAGARIDDAGNRSRHRQLPPGRSRDGDLRQSFQSRNELDAALRAVVF